MSEKKAFIIASLIIFSLLTYLFYLMLKKDILAEEKKNRFWSQDAEKKENNIQIEIKTLK